MTKQDFFDLFPPNAKSAVIVLSGGMDSTTAMRLCVEKFSAENVHALSFYYKQRQSIELALARESTKKLGVKHKLINMEFYGDICKGFTANVDRNIQMPTMADVLGDPSPTTYVPNRNMIMLSICAAYAETNKLDLVVIGLQVHDVYSYYDTSPSFILKLNDALAENRKHKVQIFAPFNKVNKTEELKLLLELDGNVDILKHTIGCYDPDDIGRSCGICPACSQRIKAFQNVNIKDPIRYSKEIEWAT